MINFSAIFSKMIAIILFAVSFLLPGNPDDVAISADVSSSDKQVITVEWQNNTGKAIKNPTYYIEKLEDEEWQSVEFAEDFGFPEIYTQYYPTESGKITVNGKKDLKEPLTKGTYRITLCYELLYCDTRNGSSSVEFTI
ncbi:MAG: hypothetical protein IKL10_05625 [Clostridia bacterium]|nr:hypothetical protein [Clostridia bacterium]